MIAGDYKAKPESKGPAMTHTPIKVYLLNVTKGSQLSLDLPEGSNTILLKIKKDTIIQGKHLEQGEIAIFEREGESIELSAEEGAQILVLNGEPIDEPAVAYGPFVMNHRSTIAT